MPPELAEQLPRLRELLDAWSLPVLEKERFEMLLEVRQVLSYQQWRRIEELKQRIKQGRSEQGRPGAGGQRPPGERPQSY